MMSEIVHSGLLSGTACKAWAGLVREDGTREGETRRGEGREVTARGSSGCTPQQEEGRGIGRVGSEEAGRGSSPRGC